MASSGKQKTTFSKLARESKLRERRLEKQAKKAARKRASENQPPQLTAHRQPSSGNCRGRAASLDRERRGLSARCSSWPGSSVYVASSGGAPGSGR